ncbi:MAG: phenylalanine--tRNA ligase subunit beta [Pyrinomonadaceae bacterium]
MNISYNWLKDLIEIDLPPPALAKNLTDAGLAVEGIHAHGDDFVFDIDLTSNRADCLSHLGVAREISAIIPDSRFRIQDSEDDSRLLTRAARLTPLAAIEDSDLCHRFTARIIRNVKIGASPEWLKKRLEAVGERVVNNVSDITNYVMLELGNPMHSFDLNKLAENRIVVRRARNGETIKTLDDIERQLDETMLAICDAEKPVAVAGIMGGLDSSITGDTTDVLLEVAYFKRENIRRTSRKLNLSTEASYRFERGTDIENLVRASNRAAELICELANGEAAEFIDVYPVKFQPNEIESNDIQASVKRITGLNVETKEILRILAALGIRQKNSELKTLNSELKTPNSRLFLSPRWRHDIAIEEDLVEEAARIVGYDKIDEELPPSFSAGEYQPSEIRKFQLRRTLANLGFDEAISYSFIDTRRDEIFDSIPDFVDENSDEKFVTLKDSIIEGAVRMRPTLLTGLLDAVRTNFNHQNRNLKLFELGKVFANNPKSETRNPKSGGLPDERELLALILTGSETLQNKASAVRGFDFYDAKGALEAAVEAVNSPPLEFVVKNVKHLRRGQSAEIFLNEKPIGTIGRLNDEISDNYKFRQSVFVAEIDLQTLLETKQENILYHPLPVFPLVERDISLLVNRATSFDKIKKSITAENIELLRGIEFVDVYEGKGVADDARSITMRLKYRSNERTLIDAEVEAIHDRILEMLASKLNVRQRF